MQERKTIKRPIFIGIFSIGTLICFFVWFNLLCQDIEGLQRNLFFANREDWFMDFFNTLYYSIGKTPYNWGYVAARNYLPISYMLVYPFSKLFPYNTEDWPYTYLARYNSLAMVGLVVFLVASFGFLFHCLYKSAKGSEIEKFALMAAFFLNGVILYNFERANLLIVSTAFLCVYLILIDSENKIYRHVGYMSLALSAAFKIFPAIFGVILIYKKRFKDAAITLVYGVLVAFLPFFWLEGPVTTNLKLFWEALRIHGEEYADGSIGLFAKTFFYDAVPTSVAATVIFTLLPLVLAYFHRDWWKQVMLLSLALLMPSGQMEYYCILYLFFPMVLFFNEEKHNPLHLIWVFIFIAMLSPIQFETEKLNAMGLLNTVCVVSYAYLSIEGLVRMILTVTKAHKKPKIQEEVKA